MKKIITPADIQLIQPEWREVKTKLENILTKAPANLKKALTSQFLPITPGLGALLLLVIAKKQNLHLGKQQQIVDLAVSINLLQMTIAIHQNLVHTSANKKDDLVYSGDFLLTEFFDLVIEAVQDKAYLTKNAKVIQQIVSGQIFDLSLKSKATFGEIKQNLAAKSTIFALAAEEGAYFTGDTIEEVRIFKEIGARLGVNLEALDLPSARYRKHINNYLVENKEKVDFSLLSLPPAENLTVLKKINKRLLDKKSPAT